MKRLVLLRHAKSSWDDTGVRDFDRPLNDKGRRAARVVGGYLASERIAFDHVAASPARRVAETLDEVARGYGAPLVPTWDQRLYLAPPETLLDVVRATPVGVSTLLLAGHSPGVEGLVLMLVPDRADDGAREAVEEKYPTAAVAEMVLPCDDWRTVCASSATLLRFVRPRDLDPALGPDAAA